MVSTVIATDSEVKHGMTSPISGNGHDFNIINGGKEIMQAIIDHEKVILSGGHISMALDLLFVKCIFKITINLQEGQT